MAKQAIYKRVFEEMKANGTLDHFKVAVQMADGKYDQNHCYTWAQVTGVYGNLQKAYVAETPYFIAPINSLRKFRALVEDYCR